jgi:hypothetical protein
MPSTPFGPGHRHQIGFAVTGFGPSIAAARQGYTATAWLPAAVLVCVSCVIAAISASTAREIYNVDMDSLGRAAA